MPCVNTDLPRRPGQQHSCLRRSAVAFPVIAAEAAGNQVLPGRAAASRARDYVIHREILRREFGPAILARTPIPQEDALARDRPVPSRDPLVVLKPHDARNREIDLRRANRVRRPLLHHRRALEDERQRAPRRLAPWTGNDPALT